MKTGGSSKVRLGYCRAWNRRVVYIFFNYREKENGSENVVSSLNIPGKCMVVP